MNPKPSNCACVYFLTLIAAHCAFIRSVILFLRKHGALRTVVGRAGPACASDARSMDAPMPARVRRAKTRKRGDFWRGAFEVNCARLERRCYALRKILPCVLRNVEGIWIGVTEQKSAARDHSSGSTGGIVKRILWTLTSCIVRTARTPGSARMRCCSANRSSSSRHSTCTHRSASPRTVDR